MQPDFLRLGSSRASHVDAAIARADDWLDSHRSQLTEFCVRLLQTPSDNPPGDCTEIATMAEATLGRLGVAVTSLAVPRPGAPDSRIVLGWHGHESKEPAIVLSAHLDVIAPGPGWSVDPYGGEIRDGRMYGRGAAASKAAAAAYVFALAAGAAALNSFATPSAAVVLTSDEETGGGFGPQWLLEEYGLKPGMAICPGSTYKVATAHNGCIQADVVLVATPQHAATAVTSGDAWPTALEILGRLEKLRGDLSERRSTVPGIGTANLVVSGVHGGGLPGTTIGSLTITIDRRVIPEESMDDALSELRDAVLGSASGEVGVQFQPTLVAATMKPDDSQYPLAELLRAEASRVLGTPVTATGVPIFTDARWFAGHGVPTVMFGVGYSNPADGNGHGPDENAGIAETEAAARTIAHALVRVLYPDPAGSSRADAAAGA